MPNRTTRPIPIALTSVAVLYVIVGAFVEVYSTMSAIDPANAALTRGLYQLFFTSNDFLILYAYWMGMRLGAKHWSTWTVPVFIAVLASALTYFVAPPFVSAFASRASSSQLNLSANTFQYLILYEGGPFALTLWFAVSLVWLLSRVFGVYLVPCGPDEKQIDLEGPRPIHKAIFCLSVAVMAVIYFCLSLLSLIDYSRILVATSVIFLWFGFATLVSNGLRSFSWVGVTCVAVGLVLPFSFWPWLLSRRMPFGMIAMVCFFGVLWSLLKWFLCAWALRVCGYRLVSYRHNATGTTSTNNESKNRSVDGTTIDSPIREWII